MTEPRLIQLVDFERDQGGSLIPGLAAVLEAARRRGFRAEAVFPEAAGTAGWMAALRSHGFPIHLAPPTRSDRRLAGWLDRLLDERPAPTVLHSHFTGFDIASTLAARRRSDVRVVWHLHGPLSRKPLQLARTALKFGIFGRGVDAMLCPAENVAAGARRRGVRRSRVHLEPSGVPVDTFALASPEDRARARTRLGIPEDATVLLHFGWHWRMKGGDLYLGALPKLAERFDGELIALERGGKQAEYLPAAARLGVEGMLRFVPPIGDVRSLHATADVLVATGRDEGMPFAILEALCVGVPVVATDIPGQAFVGREVEACRMTALEPEAIAAGIEAILSRPAERAASERAAARAWIVANLSADATAERLVDRYQALLNGRP